MGKPDRGRKDGQDPGERKAVSFKLRDGGRYPGRRGTAEALRASGDKEVKKGPVRRA